VLVDGEHGGAAAVLPHDGGATARMAWREPTPRPKQTLMRLRGQKGGENEAAARFAGIGVATAVNPTMTNSRNVAHLGEISSNRGVEKMEELEADLETLGGEARRRGEGARSSRSSGRQWRWRYRRRSRERESKEESGRALGECGVSWRPWRRRQPDERGQRRHMGAKWQPGVALGDHDGELGSESDHAITDWQSYFDDDYLPNQGELGDGVVDKVEVLAEFYNIVN